MPVKYYEWVPKMKIVVVGSLTVVANNSCCSCFLTWMACLARSLSGQIRLAAKLNGVPATHGPTGGNIENPYFRNVVWTAPRSVLGTSATLKLLMHLVTPPPPPVPLASSTVHGGGLPQPNFLGHTDVPLVFSPTTNRILFLAPHQPHALAPAVRKTHAASG